MAFLLTVLKKFDLVSSGDGRCCLVSVSAVRDEIPLLHAAVFDGYVDVQFLVVFNQNKNVRGGHDKNFDNYLSRPKDLKHQSLKVTMFSDNAWDIDVSTVSDGTLFMTVKCHDKGLIESANLSSVSLACRLVQTEDGYYVPYKVVVTSAGPKVEASFHVHNRHYCLGCSDGIKTSYPVTVRIDEYNVSVKGFVDEKIGVFGTKRIRPVLVLDNAWDESGPDTGFNSNPLYEQRLEPDIKLHDVVERKPKDAPFSVAFSRFSGDVKEMVGLHDNARNTEKERRGLVTNVPFTLSLLGDIIEWDHTERWKNFFMTSNGVLNFEAVLKYGNFVPECHSVQQLRDIACRVKTNLKHFRPRKCVNPLIEDHFGKYDVHPGARKMYNGALFVGEIYVPNSWKGKVVLGLNDCVHYFCELTNFVRVVYQDRTFSLFPANCYDVTRCYFVVGDQLWVTCDDALCRVDYFCERPGIFPGSILRTWHSDMVYLNSREAMSCIGCWYGRSFMLGVFDIAGQSLQLGKHTQKTGFILRWFRKMTVEDFDLPDIYYHNYDSITECYPEAPELKRNTRLEKKDLRPKLKTDMTEFCIKLKQKMEASFWIVEGSGEGFGVGGMSSTVPVSGMESVKGKEKLKKWEVFDEIVPYNTEPIHHNVKNVWSIPKSKKNHVVSQIEAENLN